MQRLASPVPTMSSKAMYTPEYSDELLALVVELYREEVRPALGELKLSKMIDLLEVAQWNLEQYTQQLRTNGDHIELLRHYIVGLLYVYLVIPSSIQFQIKNKNYEVFLTLRQLYEKETNMSNVKLLTTDYIQYLNDKSSLSQQFESLNVKSRSKRSSTLPSSSLDPDLSHYTKPPTLSQTSQHQHHSQSEKFLTVVRTQSGTDVASLASTNSSIVDDLWSPPELQPNDQLKLVTEQDYASTDDISRAPPSHFPPPVPPNITVQPDTVPRAASQVRVSSPPLRLQHPRSFPTTPESGEVTFTGEDFGNIPEENYREYFVPKASHRKDSYHSVYAEDEEALTSVQFISSKSLVEELQAGNHSFLIFDIRPLKRFTANHIQYEDTINIDPSLVIDSKSWQELEDALYTSLPRDLFLKFRNIHRFDQVVIYTDNSTSLSTSADYITKLSMLLGERKINSRALRGGFDSWTKYLSKNDIKKSDLKFATRQPLTVPLPPSVPPPPVPQPLSDPSDGPTDISAQTSGLLRQAQVIPHPTASHIPPLPPSKPPIPPPHMVNSSRPYPVQQSFYNTSQLQYSSQAQQSHGYPHQPQLQGNISNQVYSRPAVDVPRSDTELQNGYIDHSNPQYHQMHSHYRQHQSHHQQQTHTQGHGSQQALQRRRLNSESIPTIQRSQNTFVRLSITGLRNMGNTCYINSMLQCLFASSKFRDVFIDNAFEDYTNTSFQKARLSPSLSMLFKKMYLNGGCSIVPNGFLKACIALRPDLRIPSEQQDTQEFLMFMLDHLHDELSNSNAVVNDYPQLMQHGDLGEDYEKWFGGLIKQGFSPISSVFQGQLQDSLQCRNCGHKSSNFSTFYMLSLVIPKTTSAFGKKPKKVSLEDCIQMFTNEEVLTGDNAWDCPKCAKRREQLSAVNSNGGNTLTPTTSSFKPQEKERKHRLHFTNGFKFRGRSSSPAPKKDKEDKRERDFWKRSATQQAQSSASLGNDAGGDGFSHSRRKSTTVKSLTFVVLPPVLVIHLSRFLFYDTSQKDTAIVQYPLILEIPHQGSTVKYKLFGVVNHYGTLKSGHYTSIANKSLDHDLIQPNWYYFDDETVKMTEHGSYNGKDPVHMSSSEVYVLFYERI